MVKIVLISPSPSPAAGFIRASHVALPRGAEFDDNRETTEIGQLRPHVSCRLSEAGYGIGKAGLIGACRISPILRPFQRMKEAIDRRYGPSKQCARLRGDGGVLSQGIEEEDRIDSHGKGKGVEAVRAARQNCLFIDRAAPEKRYQPGRLCEGGTQASEMVALRRVWTSGVACPIVSTIHLRCFFCACGQAVHRFLLPNASPPFADLFRVYVADLFRVYVADLFRVYVADLFRVYVADLFRVYVAAFRRVRSSL